MALEKATLGGGCFWCLEAIFQQMKGVTDVASGYAGGEVDNPTYNQVCKGLTQAHAEVVQVTFDSDIISYRDLLTIFFTIHDPTTLNQQGNDVGPQYRSVVFYHNPEQKKIAEEVIVKDGRHLVVTYRDRAASVFRVLPCRGLPQGFLQTESGTGLLHLRH